MEAQDHIHPEKAELHRKSLHKASAPPLHAPKRSIASTAYWEQVG